MEEDAIRRGKWRSPGVEAAIDYLRKKAEARSREEMIGKVVAVTLAWIWATALVMFLIYSY